MAAGHENADEFDSIVHRATIDQDVVVASYRGYIREMCPRMIGTRSAP
jgi:hypothetical protein